MSDDTAYPPKCRPQSSAPGRRDAGSCPSGTSNREKDETMDAGYWRDVARDEVFAPGRKFRINLSGGNQIWCESNPTPDEALSPLSDGEPGAACGPGQGAASDVTSDLTITVGEFSNSQAAKGKAITQPWSFFVGRLTHHEITADDTKEAKDGSNYVFATLHRKTDGCVGRKLMDVLQRTALTFDVETNRETGEVPPSFEKMVARIRKAGWAVVVYTSFNHTPELPRYRIVMPLTHPIDPKLPAIDVVAERLGIAGVLDFGKSGAGSVFFHPRAPKARQQHCRAVEINGACLDADLVSTWAAELQAKWAEEQAHKAREGAEAKERRRAELLARGVDPNWSLIEQIKAKLALANVDLAVKLDEHGYEMDDKGDYRHAASSSGSFGLRIFTGDDGEERAYSLNGTDPLHEENLKARGLTSKAADVLDVITVLEYGGDQKGALRALAEHYNIESPGAWREKLKRSAKGVPTPFLLNAVLAFREAPEWRGRLGYDEFADQTKLLAAPPWGGGSGPREIIDNDATRAAIWLQGHGIAVSSSVAMEALHAVAHDLKFHPVRDYLSGLTWDGKPRLNGILVEHLGAEDTRVNRAFGAKALIGAVARIMQPGCLVKTVLLLEGEQDIGKSSFCRALCHDPDWFTDNVPDLNSKDAQQQLRGIWIQEHAEMDRMGKADAARIKAFISSRDDRYRPSFGRVARTFPRQCIFVGTINPGGSGYLRDETGAVRFWPVSCGVNWTPGRSVDVAKLTATRDQVWAEAVVRYQKDETWWLDDDKLRRDQVTATDERFADEAWGEMIRIYIADKPVVTTEMIRRECLYVPLERWTNAAQQRVGAVLRKEGWKSERLRMSTSRAYAYIPKTKGARERAQRYLEAAALRAEVEANGGKPALEMLLG